MFTLYCKSIIFDMDGVITNTMPFHYKAWQKALKKRSIDISKYEIYSREGQKGIQSVLEILVDRGLRFSQKEAIKILQQKEEIFKEIVKPRFIKGSMEYVNSLYQQNFKLGLVTGTSASEVRKILPDYLYQMFSAMITADNVKKGKPHPEPYQRALNKLKVDARLAVVIENAPFGITSAKKAGIRCVALATSLPRNYLMTADMVFPSFNALSKRVQFVLSSEQDNEI